MLMCPYDFRCCVRFLISQATNPNALLTVLDHADLSVLDTVSPPADRYQASLSFLAATWKVATKQGSPPVRYEVSLGRSNQDIPLGVFDRLRENIWRDVGLQTSSVTTLKAG